MKVVEKKISTQPAAKSISKSEQFVNIELKPSMTVAELKTLFNELLSLQLSVLTPKGNEAGDSRKLRALTETDLNGKIVQLNGAEKNSVIQTLKSETGLQVQILL